MIINHRNNDEYLELLRQDKVPVGKGLGIALDNNLRFKESSFKAEQAFLRILAEMLCLVKTFSELRVLEL